MVLQYLVGETVMTNQQDKKVRMKVPVEGNVLLSQVLDRINNSDEIKTYWKVINTNAIDRRGMSDHGHVHFQIVANVGLRILRLLKEKNITPSVVTDFDLTYEHAEVIVFLACIFHDLGMVIDREGHEEFSLVIAYDQLHKMLAFLPDEERVIITSEVMHAIISHRSGGHPRTIEAGVMRVADALDMSEGRSRIPYEAGHVDIYSVSAAAINNVEIKRGKEKPVRVFIKMNNSSGIFQVDELLKKKITGSGIEKYVEVRAEVSSKNEKKLVKKLDLFPSEKDGLDN
jgi:metal-dependent HD superfamily phosphatase/phosphodiesterase